MLRTLVVGKEKPFDHNVAYIEILKVKFVFTFLSNNVNQCQFVIIFLKIKFAVYQIDRRTKCVHRLESGF